MSPIYMEIVIKLLDSTWLLSRHIANGMIIPSFEHPGPPRVEKVIDNIGLNGLILENQLQHAIETTI